MEGNKRKDVIKQLKKIAQNIEKQQSIKYGIHINTFLITIGEYYKTDVFKKNLILTTDSGFKLNWKALTIPFKHGAFYETSNQNITIFIKDLNKIKRTNSENLFAFFISNIYHEVKHQLQQQNIEDSKLNLGTFIFNLEDFVRYFKIQDYYEHYDDYFIEIDADLYGVRSAKKYLIEHNMSSEQAIKYLKNNELKYEASLNRYDFQRIFQIFNTIFLANSKVQVDDLCSWGEYFYNQDKTFKTVEQILNNPNIHHIDDRIVEIILSSQEFLKHINFEVLSYEHKTIMMDILKKAYNNEIIRRKNIKASLNQEFISKKIWLILDTASAHNMANYMNNISACLNAMSNIDRDKTFLKDFSLDG